MGDEITASTNKMVQIIKNVVSIVKALGKETPEAQNQSSSQKLQPRWREKKKHSAPNFWVVLLRKRYFFLPSYVTDLFRAF